MTVQLTVNGKKHELDVEDDMPLLWALRDELGLTGTKYACGIAACGACTVHIDGAPVRSCSHPVGAATGNITTIEGLGSAGPKSDGGLHRVQQAWIDHQVPQCGYCQSGLIMAVAALLEANPRPSEAELAETVTNICRCGTYDRVRLAVAALAGA
jgi:isoquinoline 1-oxidoreductase alpha subunit